MAVSVNRIVVNSEVAPAQILHGLLERERPGRHAGMEDGAWLGAGEATGAVYVFA